MSYEIEYNRVFLKSQEGITPCVLMGSNNCYEPRYTSSRRGWRRDRSWGIFQNMIGVTEDDLLATVTPWLGGYQEHWKKNGKWVDDAGLIRWVKSGVRNATYLEPLLETNHMNSIRCNAYTWNPHDGRHDLLNRSCSTTSELDTWIQEVRKLTEEQKAKGVKVYPAIEWLPEDIRLPRKSTPGKVIIKEKGRYLSGYTPNSTSWTRNITDAIVIPYDEAEKLLRKTLLFGRARMVDAARKEAPNNVVLRFANGSRAGCYIIRRTRSRIYMTRKVEEATHYADEKAARAAMEKIQPVCIDCGELEVAILG